VFALGISALVISINLYFSTDYILSALGTEWYVWLLMVPLCVFYMALVLYLIVTCLQAMDVLGSDFYSVIVVVDHASHP